MAKFNSTTYGDDSANLQPEKGIVIHNITIRPVVRQTQDIQNWRNALQAAEGIMQYRTTLYDLYADLVLDAVLSSLMEKRILNVVKNKLVFHNADGKPNDDATKVLQCGQFRELRKQIMLQKFWGITVCELISETAFRIFNIDRKHIQPKEGKITFEQSGNEGIYYREQPYNKFVLEVGKWDDLGLLVKAAPYVIYKRGSFGNWANFAQIFGMPFREARYDGFNDATRRQLETALENMGSAAYGIFPKESQLTFHEASNVAANGQLYDALRNACNQELSILILGQTGTTTPTPGKLGNDDTQAETEDDINASDRSDEIDILNEKVLPIMVNLGLLPADGYFAYEVIKEKLKLTELATVINTLKNQVKLPLNDDDIYEMTGMPKPANYDELKTQQEEERQMSMNANQPQPPAPGNKKKEKPPKKKLSGENENWFDKFKTHVNGFFD